MSICPKCKKIINELLWEAKTERSGTVGLYNKGEIEWDEESQTFQEAEYHYFCPECDEELDIEPEEFLKEKDELQEIVAEKIDKIKGKKW